MTAAATPLLTGSRSAIAPISFSRVLAYEFRKSVSTRASRWALAVTTVVTVTLAVFLYLYFSQTKFDTTPQLTWTQLAGYYDDKAFPLSIAEVSAILLGPFLILLTASEWTNRSIITTFTLVPRRGRVLSAQLIVALTYIAAFWALHLGLGALVAGLLSPSQNVDINWSVTLWDVVGLLVGNLGYPMFALAMGIAIMSVPAAIVAWVMLDVLMNVFLTISEAGQWSYLIAALRTAATDPNTATNWAHVATSAVLWLAVPAVIGIWRSLRREAS